jgi:hypothetical protein
VKEALDEVRLALHPFHGIAQCTRCGGRRKPQTFRHSTLELLLELLVGVQLRGIGRQALQVETVRSAVREALFDGLAVVDRRASQDEHHPARDLAPQIGAPSLEVLGFFPVLGC